MHHRPGARYRVSRLLFLCFGNSCRSQMAEGWVRHLCSGQLDVQSAGIEAHGVNPRALAVMREAGIDISRQQCTRLTPRQLTWAKLVVTVCDHADEHLLWLPARARKEHWSIRDPAAASGPEETIMKTFRVARDEIGRRVRQLLGRIHNAGSVAQPQRAPVVLC